MALNLTKSEPYISHVDCSLAWYLWRKCLLPPDARVEQLTREAIEGGSGPDPAVCIAISPLRGADLAIKSPAVLSWR
jgi:hypothetical protein